jgi:hypothetical protein
VRRDAARRHPAAFHHVDRAPVLGKGHRDDAFQTDRREAVREDGARRLRRKALAPLRLVENIRKLDFGGRLEMPEARVTDDRAGFLEDDSVRSPITTECKSPKPIL